MLPLGFGIWLLLWATPDDYLKRLVKFIRADAMLMTGASRRVRCQTIAPHFQTFDRNRVGPEGRR